MRNNEKVTNLLQLLFVRFAFLVLVLHQSPVKTAKIPFVNYSSTSGIWILISQNPQTILYNGTDFTKEQLKGKYVTVNIPVACENADCQFEYGAIQFYASTLQNDIYIPDNDQVKYTDNYFADKYFVEIDDYSTAVTENVYGFGSVDFVKGKTVFGVFLEKQNAEMELEGAKFFKQAAWQQTDQEPNSMANLGVFGLGPNSPYWDYIFKNYEGPEGNNDIYVAFLSGKQDDSSYKIIRSDPLEEEAWEGSKELVIRMGDELEFTQYDGSSIKKDTEIPITPVVLENQGQDNGIWQVKSTINLDTGSGGMEMLLEGRACFEISKPNFLTVKTQEIKDNFNAKISKLGCGNADCINVYLPEEYLPNLKISFSNSDNTISTPNYIYKQGIYLRSLTVNKGLEVAIDVSQNMPEGCDFIYGTSLFSLSQIHLGISNTDGKLSTNMKIFPETKYSDSVSSKWGLALQITLTVCILACILGSCGYSVYFCKYRKAQSRTYGGGLTERDDDYINGEALANDNVGVPQQNNNLNTHTTIVGNTATTAGVSGYVPPPI